MYTASYYNYYITCTVAGEQTNTYFITHWNNMVPIGIWYQNSTHTENMLWAEVPKEQTDLTPLGLFTKFCQYSTGL